MKVRYADLIDKVQDSKLKEIVNDGLSYDNHLFKEIRKIIPKDIRIKGFSSISKISFKNYRVLVKTILDSKIFTTDELARLFLKGFYNKRKEQIEIISTELNNIGCKPIEPNFNEIFCELNPLDNNHIYNTDETSYFRPNGKKIKDIDEEDASILAALLGWAVIDEELLKEISIVEDGDSKDDELDNVEDDLTIESKAVNITDKNELIINDTNESKIIKEKIKSDNVTDFEKNIIDLQSEFLKSSELLLKLSNDLKKEIIPKDNLDFDLIQSIKEKINKLKEKFDLPQEREYNSVKELKEVYNDLQKNKDQELFNKIMDVLNQYKKIYHIKGQKLPFSHELNNLAQDYENSIKNNTVKKDEEWYIKLINGEHLYNYLIEAITLTLKEDFDEDELDKLLDNLEIECEEYNFDFYKKISRQINRRNLAFKEDIPSPDEKMNAGTDSEKISEKSSKTKQEQQQESNDFAIDLKTEKELGNDNSNVDSKNKNENEKAITSDEINGEKEKVEKNVDNKQNILDLEDESFKTTNNKDKVISESKEKDAKEKSYIKKEEQVVKETNEIPIENNEPKIVKEESNLQKETFSKEDENILKLLENEETEMAYHLSLCYENEGKKILIPSFLVQNLFLSLKIRSADAPITNKIISNIDKYIFESDSTKKTIFRNRLILASILRPSLFAYSFGSKEILEGIKYEGLDQFSSLIDSITEFMDKRGGILNFQSLINASNESQLNKFREEYLFKVEKWLNNAKTLKYRNKPKHKFSIAFNNWVDKGGWINKALKEYLKTGEVRYIKSLFEDLEEQKWKKLFYDELKSINKKYKYKSDYTENDSWFKGRIDSLKELLEEGFNYYDNNIYTKNYNYEQDKKDLLDFVKKTLNEIKELKKVLSKSDNRLSKISSKYLLKSLENLSNILSAKEDLSEKMELQKIINLPLLKLPFYDSNYDWYPVKYDSLLKETIENSINDLSSSIQEIANNHLNSGNYESFNRIISYYDIKTSNYQIDKEDLFVEKIEFKIRKIETEIERGSAYGYIFDKERSFYIASLNEIVQNYKNIEDGINYPLTDYKLEIILKKIEKLKSDRKKENLKLLSEINLSDTNKAIVNKYLDKDNFLAFRELLESIEDGEILHPEEKEDIFKNFFNIFLESFESSDYNNLLDAVSKRKKYKQIDYTSINKSQTTEAVDLLKKWKSTKAKGTFSYITEYENLKTILQSIGFTSVNLEKPEKQRRSVFFDFSCDVIKGRNQTPIPQFGSIANGSYRLICLKDNLNEEEIIEEIKLLYPVTNRALIIFYFGWLNQQSRIEISKLSKKRKLSFLILDEAVLFYLLSFNKSKFPVFVKLTAPITYAEPYQTASSNLPEEMFYGRGPQKEKLKNIVGNFSSIIYGGRQLGKTVLQREVQQIFNDPSKNNYALFVDLREGGIGFWNDIEKITDILIEQFRIIPNLIPDKVPSNVKLNYLLKKINTWLEENSESRIILFLDEADKFLELDASKDWPHIHPLKGLMENTKRRFKVIFSGLHDVRRTIKIPNNPLAHFGNPIVVGSMLEKEEAIEAQLLVRTPLESLGFEFESEDLILNILSHCNWYPSLIQIFCSHLLNIMNNKRSIKTLPMLISESDITRAYKDSKNKIKDKFHLTLNLDERYDLLANIIAFEILEEPSLQTKGISVEEISEMAFLAWGEGFDNSNPKMEIYNLLEEMTDLGILRTDSEGFFAIRTPNLIDLIGSEKQIEENINDKKRSLPQEFKRDISRIIYTKEDRELRSPFPAKYYDDILDPDKKVIIFRGSKMGGIDYIEEFLQSKERQIKLFVPSAKLIKELGFIKYWESIENKNFPKKDKVILFKSDLPYTYNDILFFRDKIINRKSVTSIFLMDPTVIWDFISSDEKMFVKLSNEKIHIINIPQWKKEILKDWFKVCCSNADLKEIYDEIGNWHYLLDRFNTLSNDSPELWKEMLKKVSNDELINNDNILNNFGIINPKMINILKQLIEWDEKLSKSEFLILANDHTENDIESENLLDYFVSLSLIDNERRVNHIVKKILTNG